MATTDLNLEEIMVRDIMTRGVAIVQWDETLPKVAEVMTEEDISCIVVIDQDDETAGIISSIDMVKAFSEKTRSEIEKTTAKEIMTPFVVEVKPQMNIKKIANIMIAENVHRVVVLSPVGRKPVGLLSSTDIVKCMRQR